MPDCCRKKISRTNSTRGQRGWLAFVLACLISTAAWSQCSFSNPSVIPDNDFITLGFSVSGLTNANLASPAQGICGVDISFNHEYLGDLTVTLISPSGTSVQLIGPTTTATLPTNLSTWNVHFVPCGSPANPDAGFTDTWSNLQGWQALTTYSGTYYPATGCLEDFNIGSANGQWLIIVQDHDLFQTGNLLSVTLIFCDPTGLNCSECIPNGGVLSPASFDRCAGENIQSSEVSVDFGNNVPSSLLYGYEYLLVSGNTILQHGISFSATLPVGSYTLCGFSYLLDDSTNVNALLASGDLSGLQQDIVSGAICGKVSNICIPVEIAAPPDTVIISTNLCNGEVFSFGGQNYTSTGTFYQLHDGPGMCDSIFEIRIAPRTLSVVIAEPDTLFCNNPAVSLSALTGGANGPFSFQWTTTFGNITSSSTLPSITVDQAGLYSVAVTDGLCNGAASTEVHADQGFPQVFVDGGVLTCAQAAIDLNPIFIPSNATVQWNGPFGFMSNQANITVTEPGNYVLSITNEHGCSTSKSVEILIDTQTVMINVFLVSKNCSAGTAILGVNSGLSVAAYNWTGPNNYSANVSQPIVTDPGMYTVAATFNNGCQRMASFLFDGDFVFPDLTVPPFDTLNCGEILTLTASSTTPGTILYWQGPNGFFALQPTIQVQQPGTYIAVSSAPNGCGVLATVDIVQGPDVFGFQPFSDTLSCSRDSVVIGIVSAQADIYQWIGFMGPGADQSSIKVGSPGVYSVIMTDTNSNCSIVTSILVPTNYTVPDFSFITDTISCLDPVANLSFVPLPGYSYSNVYWELQDLTIVPGPLLNSSSPGDYRLHAVSPNGCQNVKTVTIVADTLSPFVLIESDTLHCLDTVQIISQSLDSIIAFQWLGPGVLSSTKHLAEVNEAGLYSYLATGLNGCVNTIQVIVDSNFTLPVFTLVTDSLRCDRPATLSAITNDPILQYHWYDPAGQLIDSDSTVDVNQPGIYTFDIQGTNRCIDYDTVVLTPVTFPQISITTDTFSCTKMTATLQSHIDVQPSDMVWLDVNNDTIGQNNTIVVSDPGPFYLWVTGPNGCVTKDTATVPYDSTAPQAIIKLIGEIRCKERDVMFDGSGSLPSNLLYNWSTMGGSILSDPTMAVIQAQDSGRYQLIVTLPDNGCKDTADFHLLPSPDEITQAILAITKPRCNGELNGAISLTGIVGGVGPFLFQLNGGPPQTDSIFSQLIAGIYQFTINDAAGCAYDTLVDIPPTNIFTVDAGPDVEIHIGETITLTGTTDLVNSDIQDQVWDSLGIGLCHDCPDFDISPQETTMYTFQVTSITGCVVQDQVTVFVVEEGKFYIPNVFSPNGDGINDEVRISPTPGIQKVLQWVIFDRWGDAVFGKTNFDPNDTSVFWDGRTTTGDFANPAVFPYLLEIQLINGNIELLHGNITLIR
jgi:gliding motility-associated-like protein